MSPRAANQTLAHILGCLPLHTARMSDVVCNIFQVTVDSEVHTPVTDIAKTISDCLKFRNKIDLDVAVEALRDAFKQKKVKM